MAINVNAIKAEAEKLEKLLHKVVVPYFKKPKKGVDKVFSDEELQEVLEFPNSIIDHTLLAATATEKDVKQLCTDARKYKFKSVCINPYFVKKSKNHLSESRVKICTVVGFPLGANSPKIKVAETAQAIADGADEIDMVINIGLLKGKKYALVFEEIKEVVKKAKDKIVKVIIETACLNQKEKIIACILAKFAGADYVKTSTGFAKEGGATIDDIKLMRAVVGDTMGIKASGGIRDLETLKEMIKAGATRIGTSRSVEMVKNIKIKKTRRRKKDKE